LIEFIRQKKAQKEKNNSTMQAIHILSNTKRSSQRNKTKEMKGHSSTSLINSTKTSSVSKKKHEPNGRVHERAETSTNKKQKKFTKKTMQLNSMTSEVSSTSQCRQELSLEGSTNKRPNISSEPKKNNKSISTRNALASSGSIVSNGNRKGKLSKSSENTTASNRSSTNNTLMTSSKEDSRIYSKPLASTEKGSDNKSKKKKMEVGGLGEDSKPIRSGIWMIRKHLEPGAITIQSRDSLENPKSNPSLSCGSNECPAPCPISSEKPIHQQYGNDQTLLQEISSSDISVVQSLSNSIPLNPSSSDSNLSARSKAKHQSYQQYHQIQQRSNNDNKKPLSSPSSRTQHHSYHPKNNYSTGRNEIKVYAPKQTASVRPCNETGAAT